MRLISLVVAAAAVFAKTAEEHDADRAEFIKRINKTPGILWKAEAQERFKGQPIGASKTLCGAKKMEKKDKHRMVSQGLVEWMQKPDSSVTLPENFDSETNWPECAEVIGDIRDQSACGCCWAFGAAEAASDRMCIASKANLKMPLSAQDTCFCAERSGCNGGQLYTAWRYIKTNGLVTGGQYNNTGQLAGGWCSKFSLPHCHHHGPQGNDPYPAEGTRGCPNVRVSPRCPSKCDTDSKGNHTDFKTDKYSFTGRVAMADNDEQAIMNSIMNDGPVEAAFTVYSDFENYSGGIYHKTSNQPLGGHAIRIVGWGVEGGTKYWKVANSWNPWWGEKGYFRIVRGTNECGIEDDVVSSGKGAEWKQMRTGLSSDGVSY